MRPLKKQSNRIRRIEAGARRFCTLCEVGLSQMLTSFLDSGGVPAVSEGNHNGHVDIVLSHPANKFADLLCECKKYRNFSWHCEGCNQLLNRYHSGRASRAFCLEFVTIPDMYGRLSQLRTECEKQKPHEQRGTCSDHWMKGAFVTAHEHFTGSVVEIVHMGCNVYHPDAKR